MVVAGDSNVEHNRAVEAGIQRVVRVQRLARSAPDPGAQARELPCTIVLDDKGAATVTTTQHAFKRQACRRRIESIPEIALTCPGDGVECAAQDGPMRTMLDRSEEHTSELQSLMRISYAVFSLTKKTPNGYTTIDVFMASFTPIPKTHPIIYF